MSNDVSLDINQKSNPVQAVAPPKEDNNMLLSARKTLSLLRRSFEAEDGIPRASSMTIRSRDSSAAVTVNVL